ncbi:hypothetical protein ACFQ3Z_29685 [Streptomyces nogalater]
MTAAGAHRGTAGLLGFKRHLRAAVVPGEAAYLLSQRGVTALRGCRPRCWPRCWTAPATGRR